MWTTVLQVARNVTIPDLILWISFGCVCHTKSAVSCQSNDILAVLQQSAQAPAAETETLQVLTCVLGQGRALWALRGVEN